MTDLLGVARQRMPIAARPRAGATSGRLTDELELPAWSEPFVGDRRERARDGLARSGT